MATMITGPKGNMAYWNATPQGPRPFGFQGRFRRLQEASFAGIKASAANSNYAPWGLEGANTSDDASDFLFDITGLPLDGMLMY